MSAHFLTRRAAFQGLGVALAAPAFAAFAQSTGKSLNFLAVGDWGRDGRVPPGGGGGADGARRRRP